MKLLNWSREGRSNFEINPFDYDVDEFWRKKRREVWERVWILSDFVNNRIRIVS